MKYLLIFILFITCYANACKYSDEYKDAIMKARKWARYESEQCGLSVSEYYYWKLVAECKERGEAKNIMGGCQHWASNKTISDPEAAFAHCKILEISKKEFDEKLEQYVAENKIQKCK